MPAIDITHIRYLKPEEFKEILDAIDDNERRFNRRREALKPWLKLALRTYRATGARPAEIVGKAGREKRTQEEGFADQSRIQPHHGLRAMDLKGDHAALLEGKNTMAGRQRAQGLKPRLVTVADSAVYAELEELAERLEPGRHLFGLDHTPGKEDGYWQLTRQIRRLRPYLPTQIQDFEVRWLRHSWAIYALRSGIDIYEVARQLGHGTPERPDIATTAIYLRFNPISRDRIVNAFTQAAQPPQPATPAPRAHDCPSCGFEWHEDSEGRIVLDDRVGVALRRRHVGRQHR